MMDVYTNLIKQSIYLPGSVYSACSGTLTVVKTDSDSAQLADEDSGMLGVNVIRT